VTSGSGSASVDNPGAMFDATITGGQTFQFTFNRAGIYQYFCRPHEFMNMRGTITVQ
jgi:plastocyanin